jgi:hypothetical protein
MQPYNSMTLVWDEDEVYLEWKRRRESMILVIVPRPTTIIGVLGHLLDLLCPIVKKTLLEF